MELSLHANAATTPKTRAYIQRSKRSVAELAAELGVSETTIRRWRGRSTVADRPHTPNVLQTSLTAIEERKGRPVVFMFSGQGAQYVNMGRGLYDSESVFRAYVDQLSLIHI